MLLWQKAQCAWTCRDKWFSVVLYFLARSTTHFSSFAAWPLSLFRLLILQVKKKSFGAYGIVFFRKKKPTKKILVMRNYCLPMEEKNHHTYLKAWNLIKNTSSHPHTVTAVEGNDRTTIATWPVAIVITGDCSPVLSAGVTTTCHLLQIGTIAKCMYCKGSKITRLLSS